MIHVWHMYVHFGQVNTFAIGAYGASLLAAPEAIGELSFVEKVRD